MDIKAGKISPVDLVINSPVVDSNSNALVLADMGSCKFVGNNNGWFSILSTKYKRIKILNKNGFPAATVNVLLDKFGGATEKIKELKAATYNLFNGSVVATKLDDKSIFDDALDKNYVEKKFTFPRANYLQGKRTNRLQKDQLTRNHGPHTIRKMCLSFESALNKAYSASACRNELGI